MINVYLPAVPMRFDGIKNERSPALDISSAALWGTPFILLEVDRPFAPSDMDIAIATICKKLCYQNIKPADYIVAIGDPVLIAAAVSYAICKNGVAKMLRWNRLAKAYQLVEVRIE